jgi:putative FmdB family regulatory protein
MPIYEYHCERCDQTFEVIQKFSDEPLTTHEGCGGAVERLLSSPALQFKGTGWYVTDYARKNGAATAGKTDSRSTHSDSSKSESKSTAPAPTKSDGK